MKERYLTIVTSRSRLLALALRAALKVLSRAKHSVSATRRLPSRAHADAALLCATFCITFCVTSPSPAQSLLPATEQPAWNAIGRVNVAGLKQRGMCTGTLVAPDLVLTAAHCLYRSGGTPARAEDVHFVAGWRQGKYVAHQTGAEIHISPDYDPNLPPLASSVPRDVGFVFLDSPIPETEVSPLPLAALPDTTSRLDLIGYRRDRPHAPSRQTGCNVTHRAPGLIGLDCPVIQGASGGPVLWDSPDGWRVVGLVSAATTSSGETRSLSALIPLEMVPPAPTW